MSDDGQLEFMNATIAEISKAGGYYPEITPDMKPRDEEILHEDRMLNHDIMCYTSMRIARDASALWSFMLTELGSLSSTSVRHASYLS